MASHLPTAAPPFYEAIADRARRREVFADAKPTAERLRCDALGVESEAWYLVHLDPAHKDRAWVGLYTPDRWLSESIEADLMHLGDKLEDLLDEELVDLGFEGGPLPVEHFRDERKRYVFRSPVTLPDGPSSASAVDRATAVLLAYEACFRQLGDMQPSED